MTHLLIFIFPGQASQYVGMGRDLYDNSPAAQRLMDGVASLEGLTHIPDICFNGPDQLLTRTDNVQPAITAVSLMALTALREAFADDPDTIRPAVCTGHSLGEYAAHAAAGNLSVDLVMQLVHRRGWWMNEASQPPYPAGAMVAVMGLAVHQLAEIVQQIGTGQIAIANINSRSQIILSGEKEAIHKATELAKRQGARKCVALNVSGAWHSPLMIPAQKKMEQLLMTEITADKVSFSDTIPVVANASGDVVKDRGALSHTLADQITAPVHWEKCVRKALEVCGCSEFPSDAVQEPSSYPLFIEIGPGKVLQGLLRGIDKKLEVVNVESTEGIDKLKQILAH